MTRFCPYCENLREVTARKKNEIFNIRGEEVPLETAVLECDTCHQEFAPTEMEEANFKKAYDIFRTRHRLLFPNEIAAIRMKYELGQQALSRLLGWGEMTMHNYETGALPDETHDRLLKLIKSPQNMLVLFQKNRERISPQDADELEEVLNSLLQEKEPYQYA